MAEDIDGTLYVATAGYGLFAIAPGDTMARVVSGMDFGQDINFLQDIFIDSHRRLWIVTSSGHIVCRSLERPADSPIVNERPQMGIVEQVVEDSHGRILVVAQKGVLIYDGKKMSPLSGVDTSMTYRCAMDHDGALLFGTVGNGPWQLSADGQWAPFDGGTDGALAMAKVGQIMRDRSGNLWIGLTEKGLAFIPGSRPLFDSFSFDRTGVRSRGVLSSIAKTADGWIYGTVHNECLYRGHNADEVEKVLTLPEINHVYRDQQDRLWIGTDNEVLAYNPQSKALSHLCHLDGVSVNAMADDGQGTLYVSCFSKGMAIVNTATGHVRHLSMTQRADSLRGWLCNDWIMSMMSDSEGLVWIGTMSGVACYDPANDSFRRYGWNTLLDGSVCMSLAEDAHGGIAIGTTLGLYRFDKATGKTSIYPGSEALRDMQVSYIVPMANGDLWCSSTMGLWHYDHSEGRFESFVSGAGLNGHEYLHGVGGMTSEGQLMFGTPEGMVIFDPQQVEGFKPTVATPRLTTVLLSGVPVAMDTRSGGQPISALPASQATELTLSYQDNSFTLEFSSFDFDDIENTRLQYRVNGQRWIMGAEGSNQVGFVHLRPGRYVLEMRANNHGQTSATTTYVIEIRAPWYATTWAYMAYAMVALAVVALLVYQYYRRKRIAMEEEKMQFLINATHDIRTPLTLILNPLHRLLATTTDPEAQKRLQTIDHNANRILTLVNQILDIRRMDKKRMPLRCTPTDLVKMVENNLRAFDYAATERSIKLTFTHAVPTLMAWVDRTQMDKVVNNLLGNAMKYTLEGGQIEVEMKTQGQNAVITVADTGPGLRDGEAELIFKRFYQTRTASVQGKEGTGIGLNLCKMIVDMHHGTIRAANRHEGHGCVFTVEIPLGDAHLTSEQKVAVAEETPKPKPATGQGHRVLLVDDDAEITDYISTELGNHYRFGICQNGKQAMGELLAHQYDAVVSDVMMPEMDGFTLLRIIKANNHTAHIPVILLTTEAAVANRLEGLGKGADAFMPKPFILEELQATIDSLIDGRQRLKGAYSGVREQSVDQVETPETTDYDQALMDKIIKCINKNISDSDFNVEAICTEVGISRTQLHRKMKEMTGLSTTEFLRNIRLEQAARLLKERHVGVAQVAYSLGFANKGHFSKVFKQHFGVSPSEYRDASMTGRDEDEALS